MALSLCGAQSNTNTGIPRFIALCRYCVLFFFTHGKFVATLCQASPLLSFFQWRLLTLGLRETFCSFSQYFRLFHYCYGVLWSVIFDATVVVIWGYQELCSYDGKVTTNICVLTAPLPVVAPSSLSLCLGLPVLWDITILKLGQLMTLYWPFKCSNEKRSYKSLMLNQKLEMTKLSEEGMSEAEGG